jgi:hypothetical protein
MPNWQELVRQRLSGLRLGAAEKDDVHAELAAHFEESYEALRKEGAPEQVAVRCALSQVTNWRDLQRNIFIAKSGGHLMKKRLHQLWIPGFLTLILSMILLIMLQKNGLSRMVERGPNAIPFYVPWLLSLPLLGALAAYLSSRAGGSRPVMLFASLFPALALNAAFLLMFPIGFLIEGTTGRHVDFSKVATALLRDGIGWLLVPGAALLMGGLFTVILLSRRSSSQDTAIG